MIDEKDIVHHLSLLIEIKEYLEDDNVHDGMGQSESFDLVKPILYRILEKYPLNGRTIDTRWVARAPTGRTARGTSRAGATAVDGGS